MPRLKLSVMAQADLLVPNCAALHPAGQQRITCNQPNRRVEIAVYGKN